MDIISIDLAAKENNISGIAYFIENEIKTKSLYTDKEIIDEAKKFSIVGIDAPLSLPVGRSSIEDRGPHFRECDLKLRERGYRFFPLTLGGMRSLTKRGMRLKEVFEKSGKKVYEIFPGASLDALGIRRKNIKEVKEFVKKLGYEESIKNLDESDAVVGLITLKFYFEGKGEALGGRDGEIIVIKKGLKL